MTPFCPHCGKEFHLFDLPDLMTADEVAEYLNLHRDTLARILRSGELPGAKRNGRWYIRVKDVIAYITPDGEE